MMWWTAKGGLATALVFVLSCSSCLAGPVNNEGSYECLTDDACKNPNITGYSNFQDQLFCCLAGDAIEIVYKGKDLDFSSSFFGFVDASGGDSNDTSSDVAGGGASQGQTRRDIDDPSQGKSSSNSDEPSQGQTRRDIDDPSQGKSSSNSDEPSQGQTRRDIDDPSQGKSSSNSDEPSLGQTRRDIDDPSQGKSSSNSDSSSQGQTRRDNSDSSQGNSSSNSDSSSQGSKSSRDVGDTSQGDSGKSSENSLPDQPGKDRKRDIKCTCKPVDVKKIKTKIGDFFQHMYRNVQDWLNKRH